MHSIQNIYKCSHAPCSELKTMVCHGPFSDPFQYMVGESPIWYEKFTVHFQWRSYRQSVIKLLAIPLINDQTHSNTCLELCSYATLTS